MPAIAQERLPRGSVRFQLHAVVPSPAEWLWVFATSIAHTEGGLTFSKGAYGARNGSAGTSSECPLSSFGIFARHSVS